MLVSFGYLQIISAVDKKLSVQELVCQFVGYAHLVRALSLRVIPIKQPALVRPVTRVEEGDNCLVVPQRMAPPADHHLAHVLFALKHEGMNMAVLAQALPKLPERDLLEALAEAPGGAYIRKACYLWEAFTGKRLPYEENAKGNKVLLFDPDRYITGPSIRNSRWRVDFNGLGSLRYCATVERTADICALLDFEVPVKSRVFIKSLSPGMRDRVIQLGYLWRCAVP